MNLWRRQFYFLSVAMLVVAGSCPQLRAQSSTAAANTDAKAAERDGSHDFDFEFGTWKTHLKRLVRPLSGSTTWAEYEGTTVVSKIWDGRANLVELEVDGPQGHIQALSLRLYNPQSRQWSLNFANSKSGSLSEPTIGAFKNGRGEFYDQETLNGRAIVVRFVISDITQDSVHFEQSFSDDGGKTWEVNWIATDTRVKDEAAAAKTSPPGEAVVDRDGQHGFDFEFGSWKIHLKRLEGRLVGSTKWLEFDGTSVTRKVWSGLAQLEEFETDSPGGGHIEGMTLRLFDPKTRQWSIYWSTSKDGTIGVPTIGEFKNGVGEFYDTEPSGPNGRHILLRFIWSKTNTASPHFEQSFSEDGGKTWEVNWITDQTRVSEASTAAR